MIRTTTPRLANSGALARTTPALFGGNHLRPSAPKYSDKPGMWGPRGGPPKDTLARRMDFYRFVTLKKIGSVTGMLKTKENIYRWKVFQARVWKGSVIFCMLLSAVLIGNCWFLLAYHAYSIGPTTPVLERKVKEHRISKQIMGMVREHEKELTVQADLDEAQKNLDQGNSSPNAGAPAESS